MRVMNLRSIAISVLLAASLAAAANGQHEPVAKNARILLLPRKMVSGDRATLAVLEVNGRLSPGEMLAFSSGGQFTTNAPGGGKLHSPLTLGGLFAQIQGRSGADRAGGTGDPPT